MARKPRIEFEGAFYHIITRGNQRQKIFKDTLDRIKYLEILARYKKSHPFRLYAYVLMSNHVHLLIETGAVHLSKILQGINQSYTAYFNKTYKTAGHLFQGRYKSILCDRDQYLLSLVKYIHLNPVRAKIATTPDAYPWSSHPCYAHKIVGNELVDEDQVLRLFSENKTKARKLYRAFMDDGLTVEKDDIYTIIDQRVLGDESFLDRIMQSSEIEVASKKRLRQYSLPEIAGGIEKGYGITIGQLRVKSKDRGILTGRRVFSIVASEYGYKGREIARHIRKDPAVITRYLKERSGLKEEVEKVMKHLVKRTNVNKQV
ncbi:MAG: transposase [Nitrospirae bacterium]|nr:transposase [Nitrospirota bacterium]